MFLGTLGASLLGALLTKGSSGQGTVRAAEGFVIEGEGINKKALMSVYLLTNFEIQEYYRNYEPRFNGIYSKDKLSKTIKNGAYVINLDVYEDAGTHWIALYVKDNEITYFDSSGVELVHKGIKKFIGHKTSKQIYSEYKPTI